MAHKIAIIEDDEFLRSLTVSKLEKAGFTVVTAGNGEEGISLVRKEHPDLLILDLMLPTMSGFEVLESIRKDTEVAATKVIVFSNLGEESDIKKAEALKASDYLIKANFTLDEVIEKVQKLTA
jgi:DNA-binding response OmpR family regulator